MSASTKVILVLTGLLVAELLTLYAYSLLWFRSVQPGTQVTAGLNALAWLCIIAAPLEFVVACYMIYRLHRAAAPPLPSKEEL